MYKLISWYNQNRRKFWVYFLAFGIMTMIAWRLIYMVTDNYSEVQESESKELTVNTSNLNSITIESEQSAISGEPIDNDGDELLVIDKFFEYCNSKNIKEAYNLLSDECKDEMYHSINDFLQTYYNPIFGKGRKNVVIQNWIGDIYEIKLKQDFLSTGKYTENNVLQDYITIVKDSNGQDKININKYIGREEFNRTKSTENIDIKLLRRDKYMDYETYTFEVKNNTDKKVLLGDVKNSRFSYLLDQKGLKYQAYNSEISQTQLTLLKKQSKTITIKYLNEHSSTKIIKELVFSEIICDYDNANNRKTEEIRFEL